VPTGKRMQNMSGGQEGRIRNSEEKQLRTMTDAEIMQLDEKIVLVILRIWTR